MHAPRAERRRRERRLRQRAAANGRSLEAEARAILTAAVTRPGLGAAWVAATRELRGDALPDPSAVRAARGRPGVIVLGTGVFSQPL